MNEDEDLILNPGFEEDASIVNAMDVIELASNLEDTEGNDYDVSVRQAAIATNLKDDYDCRNVCPIKIEIDEIEKIYDSLSKKIYDDMDKQYKDGKISGPTYADTWAKLMSAVVSGSLSAVVALQNKETAADRAVKMADVKLKNQQVASAKIKSENETSLAISSELLTIAKEKAEKIKNGDASDGNSIYGKNKNVLVAQEDLYKRQKFGFDDNARQKMLDSQISAWSIAWKDGSGIDIPCAVSNPSIDHTLRNINNNMGTNVTNGEMPLDCEQPPTGEEEPTPTPEPAKKAPASRAKKTKK